MMNARSSAIFTILTLGTSANALANTTAFTLQDMQKTAQGYELIIDTAQFGTNRHLSIAMGVEGVKSIKHESVSACTYLQNGNCSGELREVRQTTASFEAKFVLNCDSKALFTIFRHDSEFTNEETASDAAAIDFEHSVYRDALSQCTDLTLQVNLLAGVSFDAISGKFSITDSSSN
ncbi:hypothetical protein [Pseudoalteromonas sp. S2755]|uniref:hypothetical protein n=1 Tax=Pseudoalteromonas sp. S2755 TaxID=2066523 RepID=UPI00110BD8F9|nr:hypothetical protein [Pseudoalteromonas sp. S2755]TMN35347.1 hypothetical protein CWC03_15505 [Pseudoalteromonas sp. S2755]